MTRDTIASIIRIYDYATEIMEESQHEGAFYANADEIHIEVISILVDALKVKTEDNVGIIQEVLERSGDMKSRIDDLEKLM